ncbi:MAG: DUF4131 domain-containing protein, partial [Acidobacteria bacterium]|nr:DUF4131 domain-containing protein [Acidobacteriota bacterium]
MNWQIYLFATILLTGLSVAFLRAPFVYVLILFSFTASGAYSFQAVERSEPQNSLKNLYKTGRLLSGDPIEIEGILASGPELTVGGLYLTVATYKVYQFGRGKTVNGVVRLFAPISNDRSKFEYEELGLASGTRVRIATALAREEKYLNPGSVSFFRMLDQKGIDATGTVKSPLLVEVLDRGTGFSPLRVVFS